MTAVRARPAEPRTVVAAVYDRLFAAYGPQGWWPGGHDPFEVIVGAILVQNTAWRNVERALAALRTAGALSPAGVRALDEESLAELLRPSGTFRVKARRLRAFVTALDADFAGGLDAALALPSGDLRRWLIAIHGVGPETADAIILYAAGQPSFVIDAYTRRIADRLGLRPSAPSYEGYRALFTAESPPGAAVYNEYHALLVEHGKRRCRPRQPRCDGCPLRDLCRYDESGGIGAML